MKAPLLTLIVLSLATGLFGSPKEDAFEQRLLALYQARDVDGLMRLVEFGDSADTPAMIKESKRKGFELVAKSKVTAIKVETLSPAEARQYAEPFEKDGLVFTPTLEPVAKAVVTFEDATPGPVKMLSVAQPLGIKQGEYRVLTAQARKKPAAAK